MNEPTPNPETRIALFQHKEIRRTIHNHEWWFVVEDVVLALIESRDPKQYIQRMKQRDPELGKGWVQFVHTLLVPRVGTGADAVLRKMAQAGDTFGSAASISFGMQLRDRSEYPHDVVESPPSKASLTKFHRECYAGKDVHRFYVTFTDRYCYFNRTAKRGGCWDEDVHNAKGKILVRQIGDYPEGGLDTRGHAVLNAAFMILPRSRSVDSKFLLGVLNSGAIRFYWLNKFRDDRRTFPKIKGEYLKLLPLPKADSVKQAAVVGLVQEVLEAKRRNPAADTTALEREIDQQVYALYGLTPEEIKIVEAAATAR